MKAYQIWSSSVHHKYKKRLPTSLFFSILSAIVRMVTAVVEMCLVNKTNISKYINLPPLYMLSQLLQCHASMHNSQKNKTICFHCPRLKDKVLYGPFPLHLKIVHASLLYPHPIDNYLPQSYWTEHHGNGNEAFL